MAMMIRFGWISKQSAQDLQAALKQKNSNGAMNTRISRAPERSDDVMIEFKLPEGK